MHRMEQRDGDEKDDDEMSRIQSAAAHYRQTRTRHENARTALYAAIKAGLAAGLPIGQVAKEAGFDREYVRKIRDDK